MTDTPLRPLILTTAVLAGLSLSQASAAPAAERGRVVLNCELAADRKVTACQVTRQSPADIGLGELAVGWAIGKTIPAAQGAAPANGPTTIDLPLCYAISRSPMQATMDMTGACDAMSAQRATYMVSEISVRPAGFTVMAPGPSTQAGPSQITRDAMLKTGSSVLVTNAPPPPPARNTVAMRCQVQTTGALICTATAPQSQPELAAPALEAVRAMRVRVRQIDGAPAAGSIAFSLRAATP